MRAFGDRRERHSDDPVVQALYDQPWFHANAELGDVFDDLVAYIKQIAGSADD
jgi:hypothetical protein